MALENIMYFALGLLSAALVALVLMPAVWRRAVRLTKKRIEAATPMSMAEFRADKDQLRAEFALSTRKLEMTVESLRRRLADQLRDVSQSRVDMSGIRVEREKHSEIVKELEAREAAFRARILELERDSADLAQKLRMRDRELTEKTSQIEALRQSETRPAPAPVPVPVPVQFNGAPLSGDYNRDLDLVLGHLDLERKRADFLESQNRSLLHQLENSDQRSFELLQAAAILRGQAGQKEMRMPEPANQLVIAEAHLADAENRVTALLTQIDGVGAEGTGSAPPMLAETLEHSDELAALRAKVSDVEHTVLSASDDGTDFDPDSLRERLGVIAADVQKLVLAFENEARPDTTESLLDRVQRFSAPAQPAPQRNADSSTNSGVSERLTALRELQESH